MTDCFNGTFAVEEESTICVSEISPMIVFSFKMFHQHLYCILYQILIRYNFPFVWLSHEFHWSSLNFVEFGCFLSIFSYFFIDVHRFSLKFSYDFHRFSLNFPYDFPTICPWFSHYFLWFSLEDLETFPGPACVAARRFSGGRRCPLCWRHARRTPWQRRLDSGRHLKNGGKLVKGMIHNI